MFEEQVVAYFSRRMPELKFFPLVLPQDFVLPAAVYQVTSTGMRTHDGAILTTVRLRVDVWAATYIDAARTLDGVTAAMWGWSPAGYCLTRHETEAVAYETTANLYRGTTVFVLTGG